MWFRVQVDLLCLGKGCVWACSGFFFFDLSSEWVHQARLQLVLLVACTFHTHGCSVCIKENMNRHYKLNWFQFPACKKFMTWIIHTWYLLMFMPKATRSKSRRTKVFFELWSQFIIELLSAGPNIGSFAYCITHNTRHCKGIAGFVFQLYIVTVYINDDTKHSCEVVNYIIIK